MGKVIMSGIVPQLEVPCPYDPVFENNTWADIIEACQTKNIPDEWSVGDQKTMTIGGTDYAIDIIGKNHDDYSDGSGKAPLTFQMHECLTSVYRMNSSASNEGGWERCDMRQSYLGWDILITLPSEVQTALREVNKLTSAGGQSSAIVTTADKLFLLSEVEIFNTANHSYSGEGKQYDYYVAGNSVIKKLNATAQHYWGRSPYKNASEFFRVQNTGGAYQYNANIALGVAFAFCF